MVYPDIRSGGNEFDYYLSMQINLIPHTPPYRIMWPENVASIIGIVIVILLIATMIRAETRRGGRRTKINWPVTVVLVVLGILFNGLVGISFGRTEYLLTHGLSSWDGRIVMMVLSAVPWMIAATLFGSIPAAIVGLCSGIVRALLITHQIHTPLEIILTALIFAWLVKQPFRTAFFRAVRHPVFSALVTAFILPSIQVLLRLLTAGGSLFVRIDQVFNDFPGLIFASSGEILLAGLTCELVYKLAPLDLLSPEYLVPSPGERNLRTRFALNIAPWVFVLYFISSLVAWQLSATSVLNRKAEMAKSQGEQLVVLVQSFVQANADAILDISADTRLHYQESGEIDQALQDGLNRYPFFNQVMLLDRDLKVLASEPNFDYLQGEPDGLEAEEITRSFQDGQMRLVTLPALRDGRSAQITFIQPTRSDQSTPTRVLLGRADFNGNPEGQLLLSKMSDAQGPGMLVLLVDENGSIIYHPASSMLMSAFLQDIPADDGLYQIVTGDQQRQWLIYSGIPATGWSVEILIPGWVVQQEVLRISGLMLMLSLGIVILVCLVVWISLGNISKNITRLTAEAEKLASGQLSIPIRPIRDSDEVGQLSVSFEKMRTALKNRMDEMNSLVEVSQGVASSLALQEALGPILNAALGEKASSARIIIESDLEGDVEPVARFGMGPSSATYAFLDGQVSELTRAHGSLVINNLQRGRVLTFPPEKPYPGSLIAIPLQSDEQEHGTLWVTYDSPRNFSEEEIRFLKTLAGDAVRAVTNARLYESAALGRQRLEAVLAATPDPVLVIDQKANIILMNPAARELAGDPEASLIGKQVREVFPQEEVRKLLTAVGEKPVSREIEYPDGRVYYASLSPVILDGNLAGKVCLLRDVTRFKEIDGLKTEFVATVSHDLRSPLLTTRGYASMLSMVGELNEQQRSYLQKILDGIDVMTGMVNNLLDPDRLKGGRNLKLQEVGIGGIVREVIESLRQQAIQKKIELQVDLGTLENKMVEADPALLVRALYNLVENAIKYAPVDGKVGLIVQATRVAVQFQVSDNGNGIAPLDLPHIFDRPPVEEGGVDSSRTSWGLSIVKTIAEQHGGKVSVDSQLGKGSKFILEIPLSETRDGHKPIAAIPD